MTLETLIKKYSKGSTNSVFVNGFDSPIGKIIAAADEDFLLFVMFEDSKHVESVFQTVADELKCSFIKETNKILTVFETELKEYFEGKLKKFTVPIKTTGSDFRKDVWNKLLGISYGSTQSYGDVAKALGRPASHSRAVGAACGANNHVIVIPCHRLVASNSRGGFSCGLDRKDWLIEHEKKFSK